MDWNTIFVRHCSMKVQWKGSRRDGCCGFYSITIVFLVRPRNCTFYSSKVHATNSIIRVFRRWIIVGGGKKTTIFVIGNVCRKRVIKSTLGPFFIARAHSTVVYAPDPPSLRFRRVHVVPPPLPYLWLVVIAIILLRLRELRPIVSNPVEPGAFNRDKLFSSFCRRAGQPLL